LAGLDRVRRLAVEVVEHEVRERGGELEAGEHARLHVIRVVAAREVRDRVGRNRQPAIPLARLSAAPPRGRAPRASAERRACRRAARRGPPPRAPPAPSGPGGGGPPRRPPARPPPRRRAPPLGPRPPPPPAGTAARLPAQLARLLQPSPPRNRANPSSPSNRQPLEAVRLRVPTGSRTCASCHCGCRRPTRGSRATSRP